MGLVLMDREDTEQMGMMWVMWMHGKTKMMHQKLVDKRGRVAHV